MWCVTESGRISLTILATHMQNDQHSIPAKGSNFVFLVVPRPATKRLGGYSMEVRTHLHLVQSLRTHLHIFKVWCFIKNRG